VEHLRRVHSQILGLPEKTLQVINSILPYFADIIDTNSLKRNVMNKHAKMGAHPSVAPRV
jgi:hypothetical protein